MLIRLWQRPASARLPLSFRGRQNLAEQRRGVSPAAKSPKRPADL